MVARVFVSGYVHGVGYRQFVKEIAKEHGLKGWVKNLPDGRVQAEFYGQKERIKEAIERLWKGTFLSKVRNINIEWVKKGQVHDEFNIIH